MVNRSPSQARLIEQVIAGDAQAVQHIFQYLNAANPDLRRMMQNAIHNTYQESLWEHMLYCIAHECWPLGDVSDQIEEAAPVIEKISTFGMEKPLGESRAMQSLVELFVIDSSKVGAQEQEVKLAVLLPALGSPDRNLRWAAGYLLGLRGNERALPILDEIIETAEVGFTAHLSAEEKNFLLHWELRAVEALGALNLSTCGPLLIKALASSQHAVHIASSQAISDLNRLAEPALMAALHHPDAHVRWHAARALGQIGDPFAVDALADGLNDEKQEVRWASARVLANLDGPAIPAILKVLARSPINEPLRQAAFHALNSMTASREIYDYLRPLLDVLHRQSAISLIAVEAPAIAQQMLADWKNVEWQGSGEHKAPEESPLKIT